LLNFAFIRNTVSLALCQVFSRFKTKFTVKIVQDITKKTSSSGHTPGFRKIAEIGEFSGEIELNVKEVGISNKFAD